MTTASKSLVGALPGESSDAELVDRHRYGDELAFEEIHSRFSGLVYGLCLRMSGDVSRAQDLSQEVFLRIFRSLDRFRGRSSLKTWVYRVAVNHCRTRLSRKRLPVQSLDGCPIASTVRDRSRSPEELTVSRDVGRRVTAALLYLPGKYREAVVLRDIEGLSYREIAEVLDIRIGTVRSRIARGRDCLRTVLEDES